MEPAVIIVPRGTSKADALIDTMCKFIESDFSINAVRFPRRLLLAHQATIEGLGAHVELAEHDGRVTYTSKTRPTMEPVGITFVGRGC
jgi:hypothetical protein